MKLSEIALSESADLSITMADIIDALESDHRGFDIEGNEVSKTATGSYSEMYMTADIKLSISKRGLTVEWLALNDDEDEGSATFPMKGREADEIADDVNEATVAFLRNCQWDVDENN